MMDAINADQYSKRFCLSAMKIKDSMLYYVISLLCPSDIYYKSRV